MPEVIKLQSLLNATSGVCVSAESGSAGGGRGRFVDSVREDDGDREPLETGRCRGCNRGIETDRNP